MAETQNWQEVGGSYPSCEKIYVRNGIVGPAINPITPPLILVDPRTVGTAASGTIDLEGVAFPFGGSTRLTMKPTSAGPAIGQVMRWKDQADASVYSMGDDAFGDGKHNVWLFDNLRGIYPWYFASDLVGDTSSIITFGGGASFVSYESVTGAMRLRSGVSITLEAAGTTRVTLTATDLAVDAGTKVTAAGDAVIGGPGKLVAFYGFPAIAKPTIVGSRALGFAPGGAGFDLIAKLSALGLVIDGTVP